MSDWPTVALAAVAKLNPTRPHELRSLDDSHEVTFVPMPAVNQHSGEIDGAQVKSFGEVKKGFTYFAEGDVIFAKITPCMQNGKSAIARGLMNGLGFGSTEFHVIRPNLDRILPEWVWYFVRQKSFRNEGVHHLRGAVGQQRVAADYLGGADIPVPPVLEQRRIVARINECMQRVGEIESLRAASLTERAYLGESLIEARLFDLDGDNVSLSDVCEITSRLVDPRKAEFRAMVHVGGANIESKTGRLIHLKTAAQENLKSGKFVFGGAVVLYNKIRPYLMKVARPDFSGLCSADMYPLTLKSTKTTRDFIYYILMSRRFTDYAIAGSNRAGMPKVNRECLFGYRFKLPSLPVQRQICEQLDLAVETVHSLGQEIASTALDAAELRESILRKAFAGEL
jgi:type I restriction enzyme, S subunit